MTQQLVRLHCAIERAVARLPNASDEQRKELRRAFVAVLNSLKGVDLSDLPPLDRLQVSLDECEALGLPIATIADCRYGGFSLLSRIRSD